MKRRKAFTLIELLVVIAIIALLLSILMPSLQKVKKQSQTVVCRSNLKQLNLGLVMYLDDYNSKFWLGYKPPGPGSNWWMPAVKAYAGDVSEIRFCPAATKLRYREDGSNGPGYLDEPFTAWGRNWWLDSISPLPECHFGSYASNGWVEDKPDDLTDAVNKPKYWRRYNKITETNTVPFLTDGQWIDGWPNPGERPPENENVFWDTNNPDGIASGATGSHFERFVQNRHNKGQNVIFMDGSTRKVGLKELWTFKWHRQYNTKGVWTKAGGAKRSSWPDWMQGFEDY